MRSRSQVRATIRQFNRQQQAIDMRETGIGDAGQFRSRTSTNLRLAQSSDGSIVPMRDLSASKFEVGRSTYIDSRSARSSISFATTKVGAAYG